MAAISVYTDALGDVICERIATSSVGLKRICEELDVPYSTVTGWIYNTNHPMSEKYARAKQLQVEYLADEIIEIADDSSNDTVITEFGAKENKEWVNRSRLKVDTRKWLMGKLAPRKYGDKIDVTSGGDKVKQVFNIGGKDMEF